jgi:hypothetical protein
LVNWDEGRRTFRGFYGRRGRPSRLPENVGYFFLPGVTWPRRTQGGFNPRILPPGCVFADKGPAIFPLASVSSLLLLCWLLSRPCRALLGALSTFGAYEVGTIQRLPWPAAKLSDNQTSRLEELVENATRLRAEGDTGTETTRRFVRSSVLGVSGPRWTDRVLSYRVGRDKEIVEALSWLAEAETILENALELDDHARDYLDREVGTLVGHFPDTELTDEEAQEVGELLKGEGARKDGATPYFFDQALELLAYRTSRHPKTVVEARERLGLLPPDEPRKSAEEFVSYLVGVTFGRWHVQIGRDPSLASPQPDLFDPVPLCPPGMLVGDDGLPAREAPPGYPLELPPDRLLVDQPGHQWDVETAVRRAAAVLLDDPESILAELESILGHRALRDYLRKQFFKDHLGRYTKSRRKAPIYWYLSVPSREWGVWVYAPALSRETLYAIASHAARRQAAGRERVEALRAERDAGGRGRSAREVLTHLEGEEDLVKELEAFHAEAERIAGLGWEPALDDGIILCAAPLADLFPAWRLAAEERAKLRKGAYPWASVSQWGKRL